MSTLSPRTLRSFKQDEQGSVIIMFALMSFMLFFLAGMAIDYGRIQDLRSRVADAVDAASLAAGRALLDGTLTDAEVVELAKAYFTQNSKSASTMSLAGTPSIAVDRDSGKVDITVTSQIDMTLTRIGGFKKMVVPVKSTAVYLARDIEVGMALDITGSMKDPINGKRKIDSLKVAFKEFTKELLPENKTSSQRIRVALAPYSSTIKLGGYAAAASGGKSKDGCVTERKDATPSDIDSPYFVKADGVINVDPAGAAKPYNCDAGKPAITPLVDSKKTLDDTVDAYVADGSTGGHFGAQWAWNLVSDQWASTFSGNSQPDPYDRVYKDKLMKAVVLMTDGEFNTAYHGQKSSQQAIALCEAMKTKGVIVLSVGFGLGRDINALNTLKACATPGDGYFANAENEAELSAVLTQFASKLNKLRISK